MNGRLRCDLERDRGRDRRSRHAGAQTESKRNSHLIAPPRERNLQAPLAFYANHNQSLHPFRLWHWKVHCKTHSYEQSHVSNQKEGDSQRERRKRERKRVRRNIRFKDCASRGDMRSDLRCQVGSDKHPM